MPKKSITPAEQKKKEVMHVWIFELLIGCDFDAIICQKWVCFGGLLLFHTHFNYFHMVVQISAPQSREKKNVIEIARAATVIGGNTSANKCANTNILADIMDTSRVNCCIAKINDTNKQTERTDNAFQVGFHYRLMRVFMTFQVEFNVIGCWVGFQFSFLFANYFIFIFLVANYRYLWDSRIHKKSIICTFIDLLALFLFRSKIHKKLFIIFQLW